ncbi:MAG TPA: helix-hairpin-helix domain-containing protein [Mariprofundaceae bacterium]|nr:helix-hairpin-helix domain-containing protein [Mariprofundaceae bacterium]
MKHALTDIPGIGDNTAALLAEHGIDSVKTLLKGGAKKLTKVPGFGEARAATVLAAAEALKHDKPKKTKEEKKAKAEKKPKKEKAADKPKKHKGDKKHKKKKKK